MESPPSCSAWSEGFLLSEDSGLLLTSGSISSGSMSGESRSGHFIHNMESLESDGEDKSLSQADSLGGISDVICSENFNTLKKCPSICPIWCDPTIVKQLSSLEPPPEFQDNPLSSSKMIFKYQFSIPIHVEKFASKLMTKILGDALSICSKMTWSIHCSRECHGHTDKRKHPHANPKSLLRHRLCWTPELVPCSPCHINRPNSYNSLSSRLSSSHNSLNVQRVHNEDDSSFITQAISHDTLAAGSGISDLYNVPFDSDIYAVPVDVVQARNAQIPSKRSKQTKYRKRRRNILMGSQTELTQPATQMKQVIRDACSVSHVKSQKFISDACINGKRHSVPSSSMQQPKTEPIHMTLQEVRQYLQTLYSSSSDSFESKSKSDLRNKETIRAINSKNDIGSRYESNNSSNTNRKHKKNTFAINIKNVKVKDSSDSNKQKVPMDNIEKQIRSKKPSARSFSSNLKKSLCNLFRFRRLSSPMHMNVKKQIVSSTGQLLKEEKAACDQNLNETDVQKVSLQKRALPPLPTDSIEYNQEFVELNESDECTELCMDFASSIEKVKDYGWYWGPISSEAAEKILSNEPDGSFIVRDSSDDHYIFSLTFKLNGCVRHVRIEHDQGNFSFGSCTKFKSHTIVEFIENAVEHSRSGRYLFFLHRRPILGPMRVQLMHPVSRFKQIQSLQHMCRFVILKLVRRDLIPNLPLPKRMIDYLSMKHYYSEQFLDLEDSEGSATHNDEKLSIS